MAFISPSSAIKEYIVQLNGQVYEEDECWFPADKLSKNIIIPPFMNYSLERWLVPDTLSDESAEFEGVFSCPPGALFVREQSFSHFLSLESMIEDSPESWFEKVIADCVLSTIFPIWPYPRKALSVSSPIRCPIFCLAEISGSVVKYSWHCSKHPQRCDDLP